MPHFIETAGDFQNEQAINRRLNAIMGFFIAFTSAIFVALGFMTCQPST